MTAASTATAASGSTAATVETVTPTAPDHDEIVRVVRLYTDGFGSGDVAMFREAFHEDAWIFFTLADGTLQKAPLRDCFADWAAGGGGISARIVAVTQAGDIANVLLGFDAPGGPADSWVDLHNLLRVHGVWKIMNKTATHSTRAGPVGRGPAV